MAEGGSDGVVEKINCGLCSGTYRQPKLMPCFHTFCLSCLDTYVKNIEQVGSTFDCPLCKTKIDLPEGGVDSFQSNIYLPRSATYFIEENEESHICDLCGPDVTATSHCTICEENFCERCSEMHLKQRATRTHTLLPLSASTSGSKVPLKRRQFCAKHPNDELRVVCKDCNDELLCIICKLTYHEKHKSREIAEEANVIKENMKGNIQQTDIHMHKLQKLLRDMKQMGNEIREKRDNENKHLDNYQRNLKERIKKKMNEIREKSECKFENALQEVRRSNSEIETMITSLKDVTIQVNQLVNVTDDVFVIRYSQTVRNVAYGHIGEVERFISNKWHSNIGSTLQCGTKTKSENTRTWTQLFQSCIALEELKLASKLSQVTSYQKVKKLTIG